MNTQKQDANKFSFGKRMKSFGFAMKGIFTAIRTQHNIWVQITVAILVVIAGLWLDISIAEWLFIIFAIGFVLSAEIFNSAIEMLVDLVTPEYNQKAGLIKDMAAGAVLIAAITAAIIGLLVFIPRILRML